MTAETPPIEPDLSYLDPGDGRRIALRHRVPLDPKLPTIVFLPGYASDMEGQKAVAIDLFCAARGIGCLRLDYSGTGSSPGAFADGTLARWLDELLLAIDLGVPDGKLILVGSSMGGWLALHAALRRPDRIAGLLGIAAAPDFTDWGFSTDDKMTLLRDGKLERANPYAPEPSLTYRGFWQSGEAMRLLGAVIDIVVPVRLVHGEKDQEVPIGVALKLVERLRSADVQLKLIKSGGHRLSEPHEIHAILVELQGLVELAK
ncbi:MAG: alpha/beta hydrolase [Sphingomonas bacterium]|nr:alpha/beta hydrolase [Sphingomonas bacterium]